ncbi:MAG: fused MFS/spermidine synthase [Planctomycetes bacterium]|nr:fused MFS/spermidine synthase [Planctomycetota bacterium]
MLPVLYAITLFTGAATLLLVQPLVGKLLLPLVGGSPGVWNTCMVFFQAVLLAGYLYAHRATNKLGVRRQALFHIVVLATVLVTFKAAVAATGSPVPVITSLLPDDQDYPIFGLVALLSVAVGIPFFVLSTSSPLLQRWFAATGHPSARDPYFLYAASNAGSLVGLLGYPLLIEPRLTLAEQQWLFADAVMLYAGLVVVCVFTMIRHAKAGTTEAQSEVKAELHLSHSPIRASRVARWVFLAALPSSLMLGVTTHVSTNLAPVPLLWVVPLALYLVSFILVFARWPDSVHHAVGQLTPLLLLFVALSLLVDASEPFALIGVLHMGAFFGVCLVCHGELAKDRPPAEHLTVFYFWLSLGGVIGGLLNGLVAPLLFHRIGMIEYPLAIVLAAAVRPRSAEPGAEPPLRTADVLLVFVLLAISVALVWLVPRYVVSPLEPDEPEPWPAKLLRGGLMFGLPAVAVAALLRRPARYALCLGALFLAGAFDIGRLGETLHMERNFYGVVRVSRSPDGKFIRLIHGTTIHGQQRCDEADCPKPMTYYSESGPIGRLFQDLSKRKTKLHRVAVVGLGTGTVSYYAEAGQEWTFFEIDPAVARIAQNPEYFGFLRCCKERGVKYDIVLGDARRKLTKVPDASFDLIILDGFCSDAMPVHLLTREAFAMYFQKLTPTGVLAVNVTNPHLDLPPLVARTAGSFDSSLTVLEYHDRPGERDRKLGSIESQWMIMARSDPARDPVLFDPYWWRRTTIADGPIWRDDFANLLAVWKKSEH